MYKLINVAMAYVTAIKLSQYPSLSAGWVSDSVTQQRGWLCLRDCWVTVRAKYICERNDNSCAYLTQPTDSSNIFLNLMAVTETVGTRVIRSGRRRRIIIMGLFSLLPLTAMAESLFEELVNRAEPDNKTVLESEQMVKDHQDIKILRNLAVPPFHKRGANSLTLQNSNTYCTECHLPLPHQKQLRSRSFLNMHVAYVACETCHLRPEGVPLEYRWLSYDGGKSSVEDARFYAGNHSKAKSANDNEQQTKEPLPPRMTAVKIAPFYQNQPALVFKDSAFAQSVYQQWKAADITAKGQLRARLHTPLKKTGPECTDCHTGHDSMLDFAALGATPEQKRALERNTIADFFAHYKSKPDDQKPGKPQTDKAEERIRITDLLK